MANLSIYIVETGEYLPVTNVDLSSVYNTELITQMIPFLPKLGVGKTYRMLDSNNSVISKTETLLNLGIEDGAVIPVVALETDYSSSVTAEPAPLIVRITNSGELIPVFDVDFDSDTSEDLIRELEGVIDCPIHMIFDKAGNPVTIPLTFTQMGYLFGDVINVHIGAKEVCVVEKEDVDVEDIPDETSIR